MLKLISPSHLKCDKFAVINLSADPTLVEQSTCAMHPCQSSSHLQLAMLMLLRSHWSQALVLFVAMVFGMIIVLCYREDCQLSEWSEWSKPTDCSKYTVL
eukprot:1368860-Amphidinium_carterae.1